MFPHQYLPIAVDSTPEKCLRMPAFTMEKLAVHQAILVAYTANSRHCGGIGSSEHMHESIRTSKCINVYEIPNGSHHAAEIHSTSVPCVYVRVCCEVSGLLRPFERSSAASSHMRTCRPLFRQTCSKRAHNHTRHNTWMRLSAHSAYDLAVRSLLASHALTHP